MLNLYSVKTRVQLGEGVREEPLLDTIYSRQILTYSFDRAVMVGKRFSVGQAKKAFSGYGNLHIVASTIECILEFSGVVTDPVVLDETVVA